MARSKGPQSVPSLHPSEDAASSGSPSAGDGSPPAPSAPQADGVAPPARPAQPEVVPPPIGARPGLRDRWIAARWRRAGRRLVTTTLEQMNRRAADREAGPARRAQHRKHHGCVLAAFRLRDDIPEDLRHGLFATQGLPREALIRFSNGTGPDDRGRDSHGMAIKVTGVDGTKILEGMTEESAQDFVLADHETFPSGSPRTLILINRMLSQRGLKRLGATLRLLVFHPFTFRRSLKTLKRPSSVLDIRYFSAIPYSLGGHAVKYVVVPRGRRDAGQGVSTRDGLGEELRERLAPGRGPVIFDFGVDVRTTRAQPIEDPAVPWSAARHHVRAWLAEIVIESQDFGPANGFAENLAFSPWHALAEHRPLGRLAAVRGDVYRRLARHRHDRNWIVPRESSQVPPTYGDGQPRTFGPLYWDAPHLNWLARRRKALQERIADIVQKSPMLMRLINKVGPLQRLSNEKAIDYFASRTTHRPLPLSLWKPTSRAVTRDDPATYGASVAWPGLVDRSFTGRHLPPISEAQVAALPAPSLVRPLFERVGERVLSARSSTLFSFFAQWLTDSFLRTHPRDRRRNTSTQELDLCQIYGLGEESTRLLRAYGGGRMKSRQTAVGELPPLLVNPRTLQVRQIFENIAFDPIQAASFEQIEPPHGRACDLRQMLGATPGIPKAAIADDRWKHFYAGGLERANSTILYSAFNTLFLREHNRLAAELQRRYATRDDDWLFETARNINIAKYIKIIIEDYINHLLGSDFKLRLSPGFADRCQWYRANRITLEFNLLYRWHATVPSQFEFGGQTLGHEQFRFNNALVERYGIEPLFDAASRQRAGYVQLHNSPDFLVEADMASLAFARQFRLAGFNDYRRRWGLKPYDSYAEMTGNDAALAAELEGVYGAGGIERVEFPVGLYAEKHDRPDRVLPELLNLMVASDAFSHALTNPLLAANVYGKDGLTDFGHEEISWFGRELPGRLGAERGTATLQQLVEDNRRPGMPPALASFEWVDRS